MSFYGTPAFPTPSNPKRNPSMQDRSVTLRDHFAALALMGILASCENGLGETPRSYFASTAYNLADAMIEQRTREAERDQLALFKKNTHLLLDEAGVPQFENEQCRVSFRIRWLSSMAKDSLAALKQVMDRHCKPDPIPDGVYEVVEAAIAKAEGLTP